MGSIIDSVHTYFFQVYKQVILAVESQAFLIYKISFEKF
jgi:hypothetical protein